MEFLLKVENLKTYFFTINSILKAVDDISFRVKKEESFCLIGESGCGKSTTALSIMRMLPETARIVGGRILLEDEDIGSLDRKRLRQIWRKKIFMIFQDPMTSLNPLMKISKQIEELMRTRGNDSAEKRELYKNQIQLLQQVELLDPERVLSQFPHQLSGGMKQRVMIAMGIYANPNLLIMDEPTTALDSTVQFKIVELLANLKKRHKMSILLITHDFGVAAKLCDRIAIMYAGKIVEQGKYSSILRKPIHPYTQGLIRSVIQPGVKLEYLESMDGSLPSLLELPQGCYFQDRCEVVKSICRKVEPKLVNIGGDHFVACHHQA